MNRSLWLFAGAALVTGGAMAHLSGCLFESGLDDCFRFPGAACGNGGGTSSSSNTGGDAGTGGSTPAGCIPSDNLQAVADTCGVFVSSSLGDDKNAGTSKDKPIKTLGAALAKANGKPVYVCGESFHEALSITADTKLYGALDCANGWVYDATKRTQLTAGADAIPLRIGDATTSADVFDFAITAADAMSDGGSSLAVIVAQATAGFTRCDLAAGNGKAGAPGAAFAGSAQSGSNGLKGNDACTANTVVGGDSVTNMCGSADSVSGLGGTGATSSGGPGGPGDPQGTMNGGAGEGALVCTGGTKGDDGALGTPGLGASTAGSISATGYSGVHGGDGKPGVVAQGGGGGGGAKGGTGMGKCSGGMTGGASGSSGGSGGCGGLGGKGGEAGGASIALVSINATLSFTSVSLKAGNGGNGGDGGLGQIGGGGGMPGPAGKGKSAGFTNLNDGCSGGPGGKGGDGGRGGGGLGGPSLAIAATGNAPPKSGWTPVKGMPGSGGKGDTTNGNPGDGALGMVADCWDFGANVACK